MFVKALLSLRPNPHSKRPLPHSKSGAEEKNIRAFKIMCFLLRLNVSYQSLLAPQDEFYVYVAIIFAFTTRPLVSNAIVILTAEWTLCRFNWKQLEHWPVNELWVSKPNSVWLKVSIYWFMIYFISLHFSQLQWTVVMEEPLGCGGL